MAGTDAFLPSWEENWNYDPTGNWRGSSTGYLTKVAGSTTLNQNRTHNVVNEITDITESTGTAWPTPAQDAAGNLTLVPRPLSLGNSFDLKWDAWNRLVEVKNTGGSVIATYRYDGATRRVTSYDGTDTRHYYYSDQWQVLEERLNSSSSADRRFVWGIRSLDDLILRDDTSQRLYALSDAMGSVTAVVNTSGTVQERYGYDGFGAPRYMDGSFGSRGSSSYSWEILFDGYRYDLESGLYQVRYRYLHPNLGRWPSRDPIGEKGGKNLYAFVFNNAISWIDTDGREPTQSGGTGGANQADEPTSTECSKFSWWGQAVGVTGVDCKPQLTKWGKQMPTFLQSCVLRHEGVHAAMCDKTGIIGMIICQIPRVKACAEQRAYAESIKCAKEAMEKISDLSADDQLALKCYLASSRRSCQANKKECDKWANKTGDVPSCD